MRSHAGLRTPRTRNFVSLHDPLLGNVSVQKVVEQLHPRMAETATPQLPTDLLQSFSTEEALLAKSVLNSLPVSEAIPADDCSRDHTESGTTDRFLLRPLSLLRARKYKARRREARIKLPPTQFPLKMQ